MQYWKMALFVLVCFGGGLLLVPEVQFIVGGSLMNLGYRMQDHIGQSELNSIDNLKAEELLEMVIEHNQQASSVRKIFPRSVHYPKVAIMTCMDARIDTNELLGDSRQIYYILRSAGSILTEVQQDMLELAVVNGVKVLVITSHTDCAAEKVANDPSLSAKFSALAHEVKKREVRLAEFLKRPVIAQKIKNKELKVVTARIETKNSEMLFQAHEH